jgi:diguanylate cyclase (GGDEF)-like protein
MGKKIFYLGISCMVFLVIIALSYYLFRPDNYSNVAVLNEGWNVTYNDKYYEDVKLSELRKIIGNGTYKGDVITLRNADVDIRNYISPTIMFDSRFSAWQVYSGDSFAGQGFIDEYKSGKFIGCENNFVSLPKDNKKSVIHITLMVAEDGAYNYFEAPAVGGYVDLLMFGVYNHMFIYVTSAFLIVFGIMFFAVALGFRSDIPEVNMQMYASLLYAVLGVWFLAQFRLLELFIETKGHQTEIEYISLYLVVPLMYITIGCMRDYLKKKVFLTFFGIGTLLPIVLIIVHYTGLAHFNRTLWLYQIDAGVMIGYMFVAVLLKDAKRKRITKSQYIQVIGQIVLAACFVFNILFYYLEVNGICQQIMFSKTIIPAAALFMVFGTMLNYYTFISESFARNEEYTSLAHLAYADELTGLSNRSKYEAYMAKINKTENDYCVISIDLNGLKAINDNQGHLVGDKYITEFGEALKESFGHEGFIARIGGDEFVAVLTGNSMEKVNDIIEKLHAKLDAMNRTDPNIYRSAAIGYAFKHEIKKADSNRVYLMADQRMYKNKELLHGRRR